MDFWQKNKKEKTSEEIEKETALKERVRNIDRFPGSLEEYKILKKEQGKITEIDDIVPMPLDRPQQFVVDTLHSILQRDASEYLKGGLLGSRKETNLLEGLVEAGCIGLVRYQAFLPHLNSVIEPCFIGVPVKIKPKGEPYR